MHWTLRDDSGIGGTEINMIGVDELFIAQRHKRLIVGNDVGVPVEGHVFWSSANVDQSRGVHVFVRGGAQHVQGGR